MSMSKFYAENYQNAKLTFLQQARSVGASISSFALDCDPDLTIDVACFGADNGKPALLISSGLHGAEGFMGSAIQSAWLDQLVREDLPPLRCVLIHALNPFGFHHVRRWNEDNVDLNRHFLLPDQAYQGAPEQLARFVTLLHPKKPARRWDLFWPIAMTKIARYGIPTLKRAIAAGQYEYPHGLFFGGHAPCNTFRIVDQNVDAWVGQSDQVIHLDFHSGLGQFADYKILLAERAESDQCRWHKAAFGEHRVESGGQSNASDQTAPYEATGSLGSWLQHRFSDKQYRFATVEFGTYHPLRVLASLRKENQVHFYNEPDSPIYHSAKQELRNCFCPSDPVWRNRVCQQGIDVIKQAIDAAEELAS